MSAKLLMNLIEFVYLGKTHVNHVDLQAFIAIAESLQIKGLSSSNKKIKEIVQNASEIVGNESKILN
jgi:hypothetical protein